MTDPGSLHRIRWMLEHPRDYAAYVAARKPKPTFWQSLWRFIRENW